MNAIRADVIVTHYEPDASIFPNPERGFYIYTNLHELDPAIGKRRDEGHTLIWGRIFMEAYREVPFLPESFLAAVEKRVRHRPGPGNESHRPGILRFQRTKRRLHIVRGPANAERQKPHRATGPHLHRQRGCHRPLRSGFIGPWGEWHTTEIANDYDQGREMLFHILDHTPADRLVLVRYPYLKQQIFKRSGGDFAIVDVNNAYSGERVARVGHHNDCFLSSPIDVGTYERGEMTREEEVAYLASETLYTAFGGRPANRMHSTIASGPSPNWKPSKAATSIAAITPKYSISGPHRVVLTR